MKRILLIFPLGALLFASCGSVESESNPLDERMESNEDFEEAAMSFADGGAEDGEQYFFGVLAEVIEVDVKLREITSLDEMDSEVSMFEDAMDSCLARIDRSREALDLYKGESWPKRGELHDLTLEWLSAVEGLVVNYLKDLAEPMSRPDDTWSEEEFDLYNEYLAAWEGYSEVDGRWVAFQYEFADANGFQLSDETIDIDALVEEDLEAQE